jgi:hypothetical protein
VTGGEGLLKYGNWKQFLEDTIYRKPSEKVPLKSKNEHGFKVIFEIRNEEFKEQIYFVKKNVRSFINDHVLVNRRIYPMLTFIKYYSKLVRQYIRVYKLKEKKDFPIDLFSAQIDSGLWSKPRYKTSYMFTSQWEQQNVD